MTLKTSLVISGDSAGAVTAVDSLARSVDAAGKAGKGAAPGLATLDQAQDHAAASAREMQAAQAGAQREIADIASAAKGATSAIVAQNSATKAQTAAANDNAAALQRHAFGVRNLGQQVGDLSVMIGGGIDPMRAFATQAGQMGYALSEMGGAAGKVGTFLTGPWGIALTVGVTMLAPFVDKLLTGAEAADSAKEATASLAKQVGTSAATSTPQRARSRKPIRH